MPKVYFISGHRDITPEEFEEHYGKRLKEIVDNEPDTQFIVGDYCGADIMAQQRLLELGVIPSRVTVFCIGDYPQQCASNKFKKVKYFVTDEGRDSAMTCLSTDDLAWVRKGKEDSGTALNLKRRKRYEISKEYHGVIKKAYESGCEFLSKYHQVTFDEKEHAPIKDFTFSEALYYIKFGKKVARKGWNGKNMFLYYVPKAQYPAMTDIAKKTFGENAMVDYEAYIAMKNAQGTVSIWNPSQVDLFATDWIIVD